MWDGITTLLTYEQLGDIHFFTSSSMLHSVKLVHACIMIFIDSTPQFFLLLVSNFVGRARVGSLFRRFASSRKKYRVQRIKGEKITQKQGMWPGCRRGSLRPGLVKNLIEFGYFAGYRQYILLEPPKSRASSNFSHFPLLDASWDCALES